MSVHRAFEWLCDKLKRTESSCKDMLSCFIGLGHIFKMH
jgi:hypothetical protein